AALGDDIDVAADELVEMRPGSSREPKTIAGAGNGHRGSHDAIRARPSAGQEVGLELSPSGSRGPIYGEVVIRNATHRTRSAYGPCFVRVHRHGLDNRYLITELDHECPNCESDKPGLADAHGPRHCVDLLHLARTALEHQLLPIGRSATDVVVVQCQPMTLGKLFELGLLL